MSCVTSSIVMPSASRSVQREVFELGARQRVDRSERLVEQQDLRRERDRARDRDALLHAARELPRIVLREAFEVHGAQGLVDRARACSARARFFFLSGNATLPSTVSHGNSERP